MLNIKLLLLVGLLTLNAWCDVASGYLGHKFLIKTHSEFTPFVLGSKYEPDQVFSGWGASLGMITSQDIVINVVYRQIPIGLFEKDSLYRNPQASAFSIEIQNFNNQYLAPFGPYWRFGVEKTQAQVENVAIPNEQGELDFTANEKIVKEAYFSPYIGFGANLMFDNQLFVNYGIDFRFVVGKEDVLVNSLIRRAIGFEFGVGYVF